MTKQVLLAICAILMAVIPMHAEYDFEQDGIFYNYKDKVAHTVKVASCRKDKIDAVIPESVIHDQVGWEVVEIGRSAFQGCDALSSVSIPNSVTTIGYCAFQACGLVSVSLPNSVTTIDEMAFYGCTSLASVELPNSLTTIGTSAFGLCRSLTSVVIPGSVTHIGSGAFAYTSLTFVSIPNSVTEIGGGQFRNNPFYMCSMLLSIEVATDNPSYVSINGALYNKSVTRILAYPAGKPGEAVIPSSVTDIEMGAFGGCSVLTSVTIPNSVDIIRENAFNKCSSLTSIAIPNSVYYIFNNAFEDCSSLTSVQLPNSLRGISQSTFSGCSSLTAIEIPSSVKSIGSGAFSGCSSLISIEIPDSVTSLGEYVFLGCSALKAVTIPNSVERIEKYVFSDCSSLTSVTCLSDYPPFAIKNAFSGVPLPSATLYVPEGSIEAYRSTEPWRQFGNIAAMAGVNNLRRDSGFKVRVENGVVRIEGATVPCEVYDLRGRRVAQTNDGAIYGLGSGVYLIKSGAQSAKVVL